MKKFIFIIITFVVITPLYSMKSKPYHHNLDGTFRNPEGSPKRDSNVKWSYKIFN